MTGYKTRALSNIKRKEDGTPAYQADADADPYQQQEEEG